MGRSLLTRSFKETADLILGDDESAALRAMDTLERDLMDGPLWYHNGPVWPTPSRAIEEELVKLSREGKLEPDFHTNASYVINAIVSARDKDPEKRSRIYIRARNLQSTMAALLGNWMLDKPSTKEDFGF